jgi:serine/threonine protein kinase
MVEIGQTLSTYRVVSMLGHGGMGEVFQATDLKLGRDVALKVLPEEFARDSDRLARFQREAKLLASLNHPNIAAIYGLEESGGINFLVLELVPGETLAEQVKRGPIPVEESLKLSLQIAAALEAAHEKGVIHRDLKPANIKVTADGTVKVLDFGLAKAFAGGETEVNLSNSPTLSMAAATQQGVILGTAAYMSPEQARGKAVDKRTDIWAFGCVLYEMLTGQSAFRGEDLSEILASVIKGDVRLDLLPADIPPRVREILTRCLQKDLQKRYRDIGDVYFELNQALAEPAGTSAAVPKKQNPWRERALWITALIVVAVLLSFSLYRHMPPEGLPPMQFEIEHPYESDGNQLAISPDGGYIISGVTSVTTYATAERIFWIRLLKQSTGQSLKGTEKGFDPFCSPDGRFIGFVGEGKLKTIDIFGGPAQTLSDAAPGGGSWNDDGTILFTREAAGPIFRIPASGGAPAPVTQLDKSRDEAAHLRPYFLPDGKRFLFLALSKKPENNAIFLGSLDSKAKKLLVPSLVAAAFSPPRHLLFVRDNTLFAQEVDLKSFDPIGEPMTIAQGVTSDTNNGRVGFAVSRNGVLVYRHLGGDTKLMWFNRSGSSSFQVQSDIQYFTPALSPDGRRLAGVRRMPSKKREETDIWIQDILRKTDSRFTWHEKNLLLPVWSPDGQQIVFASNRDGGKFNLYLKSAGGARPEELLLKTDLNKFATDWSADGRYIVYYEINPKTQRDIWLLPLFGDRKPIPLLQGEYSEWFGRLSPDGRWIAYMSDETGSVEVYVQTVPTSGNKWKISNGGGFYPRWRREGKELFYTRGQNELMAVDIKAAVAPNKFDVGPSQSVFRTGIIQGYDVTSDGQRFLFDGSEESLRTNYSLTVVANWPDALLSKK